MCKKITNFAVKKEHFVDQQYKKQAKTDPFISFWTNIGCHFTMHSLLLGKEGEGGYAMGRSERHDTRRGRFRPRPDNGERGDYRSNHKWADYILRPSGKTARATIPDGAEICRGDRCRSESGDLSRHCRHDKKSVGDADIVAFPIKKKDIRLTADSAKSVVLCGAGNDSIGQWAVNSEKKKLISSLNKWYKPEIMAETKKEEDFILSTRSVVRRVYAPMLNKKGGIISHYDHLFIAYSQPIRWDWRLMAAQCYQESTFDPKAKSWAGAQGLMQIMPSTADMLGLPRDKIYDPESNIAAAAKYLGQLEAKFKDIPDRYNKQNFVLASYNGGYNHIRDAMALTEKHGGNKHSWDDVSQYVLKLANPQFYGDPVVKYGYMRGSETEDYVRKIRQRWQSYKGVKSPHTGYQGMMAKKAKKHKKKYDI